jgi:hypothetical protein
MVSREWSDRFGETTSYGRLGAFYLRHPWRAAHLLSRSLDQATYQRPANLGNFDKSAGHPPDARSDRFGLWSGFKAWIFTDRGVCYLGYFIVLLAVISKRWGEAALFAGSLGAISLAIGGLADSAETTRHLFIFNLLIDLTAIGAAAATVSNRTWLDR